MDKWQQFENNVTTFLQHTFNDVNFTLEGNSDSTIPDIKVEKNNKFLYVEAKYIPSQSGQIVVLMNDGKFQFSELSKNRRNSYTDQIINKLNENFDKYSDVEQSSINIDIDESILFGWIQQTYLDKNSQWIISSKKPENFTKNDLVFIPISEMKNYFNVSIVLRRKKSGSREISQSKREEVNKLCEELYGQSLQVIGKKSYVQLDSKPTNIYLNETYCLSKNPINTNLYELRTRGTTNNPNVMFNLKLKNNFDFKEDEFREFYRQSLF